MLLISFNFKSIIFRNRNSVFNILTGIILNNYLIEVCAHTYIKDYGRALMNRSSFFRLGFYNVSLFDILIGRLFYFKIKPSLFKLIFCHFLIHINAVWNFSCFHSLAYFNLQGIALIELSIRIYTLFNNSVFIILAVFRAYNLEFNIIAVFAYSFVVIFSDKIRHCEIVLFAAAL